MHMVSWTAGRDKLSICLVQLVPAIALSYVKFLHISFYNRYKRAVWQCKLESILSVQHLAHLLLFHIKISKSRILLNTSIYFSYVK